MNWTATLNDADFTVVGWPSLGAFAAFGLALSVLIATVVLGRGLGKPRVALWILLGTGAAMALTASAPFALWSAQGGSAGETFGSALFGVMLRRELAAAVGAIGLVGGAAAIWAAARPPSGWPGMRAGFALLSIGGAAFGVVHASWILLLGPFPVPTADLPARVHVGQRYDAVVGDDRGFDAGWTCPSATLEPTEAGTQTVLLAASRLGARVERPVTYEAGTDQMDPMWPLAAGKQWTFVQATSWHSQYLWFVSAPGEAEGPRVAVTVVTERVERGLHLLEVERSEVGQETQRWTVLGWNGQTAWIDADGELHAFLTRDEPSADAEGSLACTVKALSDWSCRCVLQAPGDPLTLPGPARCERDQGGVGSALLSGFLALITVGLVLEDPNRHHTLELIASGEATDAPPAPPLAPPPTEETPPPAR